MNEEDEEEDGEDETNCSARDNGCKTEIENVREAQPTDVALKLITETAIYITYCMKGNI